VDYFEIVFVILKKSSTFFAFSQAFFRNY